MHFALIGDPDGKGNDDKDGTKYIFCGLKPNHTVTCSSPSGNFFHVVTGGHYSDITPKLMLIYLYILTKRNMKP